MQGLSWSADLAQGALCRPEEGVAAGAGGSVLSIEHMKLQRLLLFKKVFHGQDPGEDRA